MAFLLAHDFLTETRTTTKKTKHKANKYQERKRES